MESAEQIVEQDLEDIAVDAPEEVTEDLEDISLDDALANAWDDLEAVEEAGEEVAGESEEVAHVEELMEPHAHWSEDYKSMFSALPTRAHQEAVLQRERLFEQGISQKAAEAKQHHQANQEFQQMISPLVQDWQRQGMTPSQGLMTLVALQNDLKTDPKAALVRLAQQQQIDLKSTWEEQPYVDPQTLQLQQTVQQQQQALENMQRQQYEQTQQAQLRQQQAVRNNAMQQLATFASETDENGQPKYPYVQDKTVMEVMSESLKTGQSQSLEQAYSGAVSYLRGHPLFKDMVSQSSEEQAAKVQRAKQASKVARGQHASTAIEVDDLEADILKQLDEAGYE